MGVSAASVCEIRATGSTTNGGGYDSTVANAGTDYSQQDSAQASLTGLTSAGAGNVLNCATADVLWIGNWICMTGGTNVNQGFYQITAAVANTSITLSTRKDGSSVATGIVASGTGNVGGAFKLGATTANRDDDAFFEAASNSGGTIYWIKGAHTVGVSVNISATGTAAVPHFIKGYNSARGDAPTIASGNQPSIANGANVFTLGTGWIMQNVTHTGTGTSVVSVGANGRAIDCKATNSSGVANRNAFLTGGSNCLIRGCEAISTNGYGISLGNLNAIVVVNNYVHDSAIGIRESGATTGSFFISGNIIDTMTTTGIDFSPGAMTGTLQVINNTIYMASSPTGTGVAFAASSGGIDFRNNIISGATTGVNGGGTLTAIDADYNNYYNNTTNRTNFPTGSHDVALDPGFVDAPNGNFATGVNVQRVGYPGSIPGGLTTGYSDIGAIQGDQSGWFSDVGQSNVLSSVGGYKYNSTTNNRTAGASSGGGTQMAVVGLGNNKLMGG